MAVIREDCHGLYIKNGGYIARPVPTDYTKHCVNIAWDSEYCAGDKVKAKHIGGTGMHDVGVESWSSHGSYYQTDWEADTTRTKRSTECWEPAV